MEVAPCQWLVPSIAKSSKTARDVFSSTGLTILYLVTFCFHPHQRQKNHGDLIEFLKKDDDCDYEHVDEAEGVDSDLLAHDDVRRVKAV